MAKLVGRIGIALALTMAADLLLFDVPLGVGVALWALAVGALAVACYGSRLKHGRGWRFLWLTLALASAVEPSATGVVLLIAMGWMILAMARLGPRASLIESIVRGATGGWRSLAAGPRDARRSVLIWRRRSGRTLGPTGSYAVPIAITLVFAALIIPANLVLSRWVTTLLEKAASVADVNFVRVLFWCVIFVLVYGVARFQLGRHPGHKRRRMLARQNDMELDRELRTCLHTLIATNVLFLAANVTDLAFLWMRFELPVGLTYSGYAHRGSYRLIMAVLLAAFMIVVFFRSGGRPAGHKFARWLATAFVVQNVLVLAGAASRLALYADAYGLTRFRVATMFWLAIVAIGFVLLGLRILQQRTVRFLLDTNTASVLIVLSVWSVLNIDGYVSNWNVDRHLRNPKVAVDVTYLEELGLAAFPALGRLQGSPYEGVADLAREILRAGVSRERKRHAFWSSWSYRSDLALDAAERALTVR